MYQRRQLVRLVQLTKDRTDLHRDEVVIKKMIKKNKKNCVWCFGMCMVCLFVLANSPETALACIMMRCVMINRKYYRLACESVCLCLFFWFTKDRIGLQVIIFKKKVFLVFWHVRYVCMFVRLVQLTKDRTDLHRDEVMMTKMDRIPCGLCFRAWYWDNDKKWIEYRVVCVFVHGMFVRLVQLTKDCMVMK